MVINWFVHALRSGGRWIDAPDVYGRAKHSTTLRRLVGKGVRSTALSSAGDLLRNF